MHPLPHLIIIGGGPSALALLEAWAKLSSPPAMALTLVEQKRDFALGFPYQPENALPEHTLGRTSTRRLAMGRKLERRFHAALQKLTTRGVDVELLCDTRACALHRADHGWHLEAEPATGEPITLSASHVVLACGHWRSAPAFDHPAFVASPWPVQRLRHAVPSGATTLLLGTCQTGLDAATTLALSRGRFRRSRGTLGYTPNDPDFRLVFCSRGGFFPQISAPTPTRRGSTRHITHALLDTLLERHGGYAPLDDAYAAVWDDIREAEGLDDARSTYPALSGTSYDRDLAHITAQLRRRGGARVLARSFAQASAEDASMPWGDVLWGAVDIFYRLFSRLSAEDRLRVDRHWTTLFTHIEAINRVLGERIHALLESGVATVVAVGDGSRIEPHAGGLRVVGERGVSPVADVLVDCRGQGLHLERAADAPFLTALREASLIQGALIPFTGAAPDDFPAYSRGNRVERGARVFYDAGGVFVDPETFRVIPPPATDASGAERGLYAMGPLTIGQFPQYVGLLGTRLAAERIVMDLLSSG